MDGSITFSNEGIAARRAERTAMDGRAGLSEAEASRHGWQLTFLEWGTAAWRPDARHG